MQFEVGIRAKPAIVFRVKTILAAAVVVLMVATLGVLFAGLFGLVRGIDPAKSNVLMRWRVVLQGAALVLLVILMSLLRSS